MCLGCWDGFGTAMNVVETLFGSNKVPGMMYLFLSMCQIAGPDYGLCRDWMCVWDVGMSINFQPVQD